MQINVKVIEAKNVPKMDVIGNCDPFVKVMYGDKTYKTGVKENTLNPKWNETFQFAINNKDDVLKFVVSDKDVTTDEDFAVLNFKLNSIVPKTVVDNWFDCDQLKTAKLYCKLHLQIHIDNYNVEPFHPK